MGNLDNKPNEIFQSPLSGLEEVVSACPKDMQDDIREDYGDQINSLSEIQQKELIDAWKKEDQKSIGLFERILTRIKGNQKTKGIEEKTKGIEEKTKGIEEKTKGIEEVQEEFRKSALEAAKSALSATKKIEKEIGRKYYEEIQSKLTSSISDPKTQEYFKTLGIDLNSPEARENPETQKILLARSSTQVYLERREEISKNHPDIARSLDQLESLKYKLGLESVSKDVKSLMPDIPRASRESVVREVTTINKDNPENPITRKGDTLSFKDPKNENYTYQIDIGSVPPKLRKTLNGLSIARDISPLSQEDMEGISKRDRATKELDKATKERDTIINAFWTIRRDEYALTGTKSEKQTDGSIKPVETNLYSIFVGENRASNTQYEILEQKYANGEVPEGEKLEVLAKMGEHCEQMKKDNASRSFNENLTSADREKIGNLIEKRIYTLDQLRKAEYELAKVDKKDLGFQPKTERREDWENGASDALIFFSELGIQNLGQQRFEDLMEAWNYRNKEAKTYQINLSEEPNLDGIQRRSFMEFIKGRFGSNEGERNNQMTILAKNLQNADFISNNWDTLDKRNKYLFEKTSTQETTAK